MLTRLAFLLLLALAPMSSIAGENQNVEIVKKMAEIWVEWDNLSILSQLGHLQPAQSG